MTTIDETKLNAAAAEEAQVVNQNGNNSSSKKTPWREVTMGGVAGIVLGAASALGANAIAQNGGREDDLLEDVQDASQEDTQDATHPAAAVSIPEIGDSVKVADGVNDDMSFSEAFAEARHEVGAGGVFVWHDQVYGTYYKTEWDAMSDDQKSDYWSAVHGTDVVAEPEPEIHSETSVQAEVTIIYVEHDVQQEVVVVEPESEDVNADMMDADSNDDGVIDEGEVFQMTDDGVVSMEDVCASAGDDLLEPKFDI